MAPCACNRRSRSSFGRGGRNHASAHTVAASARTSQLSASGGGGNADGGWPLADERIGTRPDGGAWVASVLVWLRSFLCKHRSLRGPDASARERISVQCAVVLRGRRSDHE